MPDKILVVDDEVEIADLIEVYLNQIRNLFFIIYYQDIYIGHDVPSSYVNLYDLF